MTINSGSSLGSGTPSIPFSQETEFTLNQVLMFDTTLNAFVNTALPSMEATGEINTASNLGAGQGVFKDKLGADLRFKTIVAGTGIAVTSDADEVFVAATSTAIGDITGGVNTGTGNAVFKDKVSADLRFRSLTAGTNITLTLNADDIVVAASTNALTLNSIADTGYVKVANNLSDVTAATARTNLSILSTAEADAKYVNLDTSRSPTVDNTTVLGDTTKRFNTIYARQFKGTADIALTAVALTGFTPGNYVAKAGGTMTGALVLSGAPTIALHAATKTYVDTVVAATIDAAPGALDTLNELAAALGDDANFSTTIAASIATKLALAGGTLTGALVLSGAPTVALHPATKAYTDAGDALQLTAASNLSDVANAATARTNLGLGTAAITASTAYLAAGTLTTGVAEGTNLYYTDARADARVTAGFAAKSTTNLSEGTNLYYTDARADARVTAGSINNLVEDTTPQLGGTLDANSNTIDMGTNIITDAKVATWDAAYTDWNASNANWDTAFGWGDHGVAGYLTSTGVLSSHTDVHTAAATDGQVLKWVNANSRWEPATDAGGIALTALSVTTGSASGTGTLAYNNSTGVFTFQPADLSSYLTSIAANSINDTHIDWGTNANQVNTADVPELTNLYFTNARADARIAANILDEDNMASNSATNTASQQSIKTYVLDTTDGLVMLAKGDTGSNVEIVFLNEFLSIYGGTGIDTVGNAAGNSITASINAAYLNAAADARIVAAGSANWNTAFGYGNHASAGYITATLTDEQVQDKVGAMFSGNTETLITVTYQDSTGDIDLVVDNNLANYSNASSGFLTSIAANSINDTHIDWGVNANQVSTADIPENTNLYYTEARAEAIAIGAVNAGFGAKSTSDLSEGTNLYYTNARADARVLQGFAALSTTNLAEGTNLYFTTARADANFDVRITAAVIDEDDMASDSAIRLPTQQSVKAYVDAQAHYSSFNADFDTRLATKTTANLTENTNLYFTNARADARITAAVGTSVQAFDADLTALAGLANTNSNFIVGNGSAWVAEDAATARASLGLGTMATALTSVYYNKTETDARFANVVGTGNNLADLADIAVSRTNLGLGTAAVQPAGAFADPLLSNLTNAVTARANLGTIGYAEGDARYYNLDENYLPTLDNVVVLGDTTKRFNTIYARQFKGEMVGTFGGSTTTDILTEGSTNLYFTDARVDARITAALIDEDNMVSNSATRLPSQQSVKAYVDAQAHYSSFNADFDTRLATKTTANLAENTNLYYTNARADARITNAGSANWNTAFGWGNHASGGYLTSVGVLSSHTDVHTAAPTDGQVLKWVNANSRWEPGSDAGHATTTTLTEGTNLYYTDARVDTRVGTKSIDVLSDVNTTSAAPTNNQVLTWVTANSRWEPATVSGGGGGEANDGANVGTAGVGVYDGKSGATLQFRKLNSLDANLTIVNDNTNNKIDFDLSGDLMLGANNLSDVASATTTRTNLGVGTTDSPTFGGEGTGAVTITATPSSGGTVAPTFSGTIFKSIPIAAGSGHKWVFGTEQDGDFNFSYRTINAAGANTSTSETYMHFDSTVPPGSKYVAIGDANIQVWLSGLGYPTADGTVNQVLKTDGAGNLGWTTASSSILTGLTDVDAVVAGDDGKVLYYDHATTSFKWKVASGHISTSTLAEGTNLYYTNARADARIVAAGSANWNTAYTHSQAAHYATSNHNTDFDTRLATKTTANLAENTNLYFTNARADARITAALIDEDNMATNSATRLPSQQSVKAYVDAQTHDSGIDDIVEDTTPQLGGNLDANSKEITGVKRLEIVDGAHTGSSLDISNGAVSGGVQKTYVLSGSTTNNTQTEIFVGAQASTRMAIANNHVWMFEVDIIALRDTSSEQAGWKYTGMIRNFTGTTYLTSNLGEIEVDPQTAWSVSVEASTVLDALVIKVTGENSKTIKWVAFVKTTQLS